MKIGERVEPARARPVPFWRQGFELPPETSPRVLVAAVPRRRAASSARTDSCSERAVEAGAEGGLVERDRLARAAAEHGSVSHRCAPPRSRCAGPGTEPRTNSRFSLGAHLDDLEAALGDALVAHLAGAADALEDARGRRRGADRARGADVVRAVAGGAAAEAVALDRALEALALGDAGDLDALAGLEHATRRRSRRRARPVALAAELDEVAQRRRVGLREVAELGLGQRLLAHAAEGELDGVVAVALARADRGHVAGAGLEHGDARDRAVLAEDLRHAELACEDRRHQLASRISMSTPAGRWSSRCSESTVFGVGWWMSISRLCVRISKCSRESLSLNGERITQ